MAEKTNNKKLVHQDKIMNDDLSEWLSQEDQLKVQKKISNQLKDKKPKGFCQICGIKVAKNVCIKCGNSVCNTDYFHIIGLCKKCLSTQTAQEWKHTKPDLKLILDVDWVD
jgi:hypothetical protein